MENCQLILIALALRSLNKANTSRPKVWIDGMRLLRQRREITANSHAIILSQEADLGV